MIPRKKPKSGAEALITALWNYFGGPTAVRDKYFPKWRVGDFFNWRVRGKVPLQLSTIIANTMKIPRWGLNYEELSMFFPGEAPAWESVVKSYKFDKETEDYILYFKPPRRYK